MNVMREMDRSRYHFTFLCYKDEEYAYEREINELGGKIIRIKDNRVRHPLRFIKDIRDVMSSERIDVVHTHVDMSSIYAMLAAKKLDIRIRIAHSHNTKFGNGDLLSGIFNSLARWIIGRLATHRLAPTSDAGYAMFKSGGFEVIRNGIDVGKFAYDSTARTMVREKYRITDNDSLIVHVGRFAVQKNHGLLLDILAELLRGGASVKLMLVGTGSLRKDVEERATKLGLRDRVIFVAPTPMIETIYSAADVFVLPSLYEGLGMVLIEAQANGLCCITGNGTSRDANLGNVRFMIKGARASDYAAAAKELINTGRRPVSPSKLEQYNINEVTRRMEAVYAE